MIFIGKRSYIDHVKANYIYEDLGVMPTFYQKVDA